MSEQSYIPINKGHYDLDTDGRKKQFEIKLSSGWEDDYAEYRNLWKKLPRIKKVRGYPLLVDLELSSKCNLNCPMCYTITDEFLDKVDRKYMDYQLFCKIIDEIAGNVYGVRLSLRGEPTLNSSLIDCVRYAKASGIKEVSMLTHGKKLNREYFTRLVDAGIDWITISVDGTGETYNKIRYPLKWEDTLARLRDISRIKGELGIDKPVIKVQGIWPAIRENPTKYYNELSKYSDLVSYNPLIDYLRNDEDILYVEGFSCPQLYQRIVIGSDGTAMMCSNDEDAQIPVGNAYQQSIHEIWHGDILNDIRSKHSTAEGFKELNVCRSCYYPRKTIPNEEALVGKRNIVIHNYVNRSQEVGK